jgi:hypothetical protein
MSGFAGNLNPIFSSFNSYGLAPAAFNPASLAGLGDPNYGTLASYGIGSGADFSTMPSISDSAIAAAIKPTQNLSNLPATTLPGQNQFGLGLNIPTIGLGISGLQTLSNIWNAFQQTNLAKQQLAYTKEVGNANLGNQVKSYNTNLADRANTAAVMNGWDSNKLASYLNQNSLPQTTLK